MSGIVKYEPAPFDVCTILLLAWLAWAARCLFNSSSFVAFGTVFAFTFVNIISAMLTTDPATTVSFLSITLYMVLLFYLTYLIVVNIEDGIHAVLSGSAVAAALASVVAISALYGVAPYAELLTYGGARARGFFKDSNVFGPFVVLSVVYLVSVLEAGGRPRIRATVICSIILLLVVANILAASRAGWLNLALSLCAYITLRLWERRHSIRHLAKVLTLFGVLGAIVGGGLALIGNTPSGEFILERAQMQRYDEDRFAVQALGLQSAIAKPFGIGPGQFEGLLGTGPFTGSGSAHSLYVRALAENGIPGFLCLATFLVLSLLRAVGLAATSWSLSKATAVVAASLIGTLVNSAVIDTLHWRNFWVLLGMVWGLHLLYKRECVAGLPSPRTGRRGGGRRSVLSDRPRWSEENECRGQM